MAALIETVELAEAELLDHAALLQLIEHSPEGIAVTDEMNRYLHINPAGCALLGQERSDLLGRPAPWPSRAHPADRQTSTGTVAPGRLVSLGRREFSCHLTDVWVGGRHRRVVMFRDVSEIRQRERQLHTFVKTAASIAFADDLASLLDRLADQVRQATGMYSCTFLLYDEAGELQQSGTAGDYPRVADYGTRVRRCRDLAAPLVSDEAISQRRTIVAKGWRQRTLEDPRFEPIHDFTREAIWDTLVVVPIQIRGRIIGVFNGFYLSDHEPDESALPFLATIAEQAAVAVDNATLLATAERQAALEERHHLARELHDSVSQLLFSLALHTRALELSAAAEATGAQWLREGLHEVQQLTQDALIEMRALIFQLRPAALHEEGLVSAIRKHASVLTARESLEVTIHEPARELFMDEAVEAQLFRVIQEALNNVVKHVAGAHATVGLQTAGTNSADLIVTIADNGPGFDPAVHEPGHYGLQSMSERVVALGGRLTVDSGCHGTTIRAFLPQVLRPSAGSEPAHERLRGSTT